MSRQDLPPRLPENIFGHILASNYAQEVSMGEHKIMVFSSHQRYLFTRNMNACSGLAIISPQAALLAHIKPMDPKMPPKRGKTAGQSYTEHIMGLIRQAFLAHKHLFGPHNPAVVVSSIHAGILALEDQRTIILSVLRDLGILDTVNVLYTTRPTAQAKAAGACRRRPLRRHSLGDGPWWRGPSTQRN